VGIIVGLGVSGLYDGDFETNDHFNEYFLQSTESKSARLMVTTHQYWTR
jgi:hypothetical protein